MIEGLPQWRCHKVVGAVKIVGVQRSDRVTDGKWWKLLHDNAGLPPFGVGDDYFRSRTSDNSRPLRHEEYIGGYLVQYEDGYLSWSPAKAFEDGYTRIG